ncbi:Signal transduction histidine kinase [Mesobacillus persicus]|uniref:histidine kinase n=1 Tax=Mesobacillus persicus TaxID=930146 RepID=A0A1H8CHG9_9BACI|nr:ATP-binding protein [Mesobacillus persicus]SEM94402.1 Signal transduction histidine kinase [Mesobacillus persicus]
MNEGTRKEVLKNEEVKAMKLFIPLFYVVFIGYDLVYYYLIPYFYQENIGRPSNGLGLLMYFLLFLVLPVIIYLIKRGNPFQVKYWLFFTFLLVDLIDNLLSFWGSKTEYMSGNIVEVFFLIFVPVFISKRFFWTVAVSLILKYGLLGLIFKSVSVIAPIALIFFLSIFGYILLSRFISYVNGMVYAYEDAKQKEKLAVVGQMAASIAHEIKNPLSALKGFTQLQQERDKQNENYYPIMLNEIDRINLIVSDLLILGKPTGATKSYASIEEILSYVVSINEPQASRQSIAIRTEIEEGLPYLYCDENQMKQVFLNLIKNSIESMMDGGNIDIKAKLIENQFIISVQDEGEGIPHEQIEKLGEPFYTSKPNGTGLGLMVTKKILEEHNGKLDISSSPKKGTRVTVVIPESLDFRNS